MRVVCSTLEAFMEHLRLYKPHWGTVYVDVTRRPLDELKHRAARYEVTFQATAVIVLAEGEEALLQYGEVCGVDYVDATQQREGTATAEAKKEQLSRWCEDCGFRLLPGVLDF